MICSPILWKIILRERTLFMEMSSKPKELRVLTKFLTLFMSNFNLLFKVVYRILKSKACRYAIKFNDMLTMNEMQQLIQLLK